MHRSAWVSAGSLAFASTMVACGGVEVELHDANPATIADAAGAPDSSGADGSTGPDAALDRCAPDAPITSVEPVDGLNGRKFQCCAVLADPLTAYFAAGDGVLAEQADLFRATRPSPDAAFDTRELIFGAGTEDSFWSPTLSADGLALHYNRAPAADVNQVKVHRSVREMTEEEFPEGTALQLGSGPLIREADPTLSDAGLYFIRNDRIHFAQATSGIFSAGDLVVELVPSGQFDRDLLPAVTVDRKTIYWGSTRFGPDVTGDVDIWLAELESDDQYSPPRILPGINSLQFDAPSWISPDGCELYFTTTRNGFNEIWLGRRDPP
jgi:hypothetical protein